MKREITCLFHGTKPEPRAKGYRPNAGPRLLLCHLHASTRHPIPGLHTKSHRLVRFIHAFTAHENAVRGQYTSVRDWSCKSKSKCQPSKRKAHVRNPSDWISKNQRAGKEDCGDKLINAPPNHLQSTRPAHPPQVPGIHICVRSWQHSCLIPPARLDNARITNHEKKTKQFHSSGIVFNAKKRRRHEWSQHRACMYVATRKRQGRVY